MNPAISVIVPVYNTEKYLRRCIDSILSQTFTDFELLLINDGSTDSSGEICDQYAAKDERVRVFHKENGGVSSARNVGLDEARGEWIAFVDSDDWVEFGYLLAFWQADCSADLLVGTAIIRKQDFPDRYCMLTPVGLLTDIKSFLSFTLGTCLMNVPWGKWFRRKLINTLRFNSSLYVGEDTFFLLHYLQKVQSITILPFSYTNRTNYVFIEKSVPFNIKYQMSVDIAVRTLTMTMALYRTLSIESLCFEKFVSETRNMIEPYVKKDPTAFCTYEEYVAGAETITDFCLLRAQSVRGQLDGTIPSTISGQMKDQDSFVDASSVWLPDMGELSDLSD